MKKFFIIIRNIFIGMFLVIYFSFIILISTLLLNRNDYGVTEFGDKALILVDEDISNENYKEGTLVIIERKELTELEKGQEVFVYQPDKKDKSVNIVIANIAEIFPEDDSPYITLANNGSAWGEEYVGGTTVSTFDKLGGFLRFIESKWVFFILLIIPCFFILLYEVYLLIIAIKFDDYEEDEEEEPKENYIEQKTVNEEVKEETKEDKLSYIEKQIMELKESSNTEISEVVEDKNEKIDDLMQQISALRKEYDEQNTFTQEIPVLNENEMLINELNDFVDTNAKVVNKLEEKKEPIVEKKEVINKKVNNNQNNNKQNKQNNNKNNNNKHNHKNNNNQRNNNRNHNKNNNNNKNRNNNKQKNNKK